MAVTFPRRRQSIMQLTMRDVTKFLEASESTVTRWIKRRGLPAQYLGGQYRFNRAELLEWATANQLKVSLQLFDQMESDSQPVPTLSEALQAGGVFYGLHDTDKDRALRAWSKSSRFPQGSTVSWSCDSSSPGRPRPRPRSGTALPSPMCAILIVLRVSQPTVTLAFLERPVDFGALDGQPVHVLFSIISPTNRSHLQLLSRLSFALHDAGLRAAVTRHAPHEVITQELSRVESGMGGSGSGGGKVA